MKKMIVLGMIVLCGFQGLIKAQMESLPEALRALPPACTTCPTSSAKFCSVCAVTGVFETLYVQNSLILCSGVTGPTGCACSYDGSISWNTQETNFNQKDFPGLYPTDMQTPYFPYADSKAIFSGWNIQPSTGVSGPNLTVTAEFEVPEDLDPSVPPIVTLHWFNNVGEDFCTGDSVNWQITADFLTNGDSFNINGVGVPTYVVNTGDIPVLYGTGAGLFRQQQTSVTIATGPTLVPGSYGQISATRIATDETSESDCQSLLSLIALKYRKTPQ